jgi:uncharacterized protein YkwD
MYFFDNKKFFITVSILVLSVFCLFVGVVAAAQVSKEKPVYSVDEVIFGINQERQKKMLKYQYFSHVNPKTEKKWSSFIKETNYQYLEIGENLATGFSNVDTMVESWMNSPSHRENILSDSFTETGLSVNVIQKPNSQEIVVAQNFGLPDTSKNPPLFIQK